MLQNRQNKLKISKTKFVAMLALPIFWHWTVTLKRCLEGGNSSKKVIKGTEVKIYPEY